MAEKVGFHFDKQQKDESPIRLDLTVKSNLVGGTRKHGFPFALPHDNHTEILGTLNDSVRLGRGVSLD